MSCNKDESIIKKDINSRFVNAEVIEIKPDSANIAVAFNVLKSLKIRVSEANLNIVKQLYPKNDQYPTYQNYLKAKMVHDTISKEMSDFEGSEYKYRDFCYYVKFVIPVNENKIQHTEYYFINKYNGDLIHRSTDWKEFLLENKYDEIIDNAMKHYGEILDLKMKLMQ
jgi:hypothetical protein